MFVFLLCLVLLIVEHIGESLDDGLGDLRGGVEGGEERGLRRDGVRERGEDTDGREAMAREPPGVRHVPNIRNEKEKQYALVSETSTRESDSSFLSFNDLKTEAASQSICICFTD